MRTIDGEYMWKWNHWIWFTWNGKGHGKWVWLLVHFQLCNEMLLVKIPTELVNNLKCQLSLEIKIMKKWNMIEKQRYK